MLKIQIELPIHSTAREELLIDEGLSPLPASVREHTGYDRILVMGRYRIALGSDAPVRWQGHRSVELGAARLRVIPADGVRSTSRIGTTTQKLGSRQRTSHRFELRRPGHSPLPLDDGIILIGRSPHCDIVLDDHSVSAFHTALLADRDWVMVHDLGSLNGTTLNSNPVRFGRVISAKLAIGETLMSIGRVRNTSPTVDLPSDAMKRVYATVTRVAHSDVSVVILGESGTGKDVIARRIHEESGRTGKFVAINAAAITSSLSSSELFGHAKGAYTGAIQDYKGAFREADGGTLFLDEIGDMPLALQAEVLRAVESKSIRPVGSVENHDVDVRIVAATNRDLEARVRRGEFREDLYHRLTVVPIELPPLRERPNDIPPLVSHFLESMEVPRTISLKALEAIKRHPWTGNVRELANALTRAAVVSDKLVIEATDLKLRKPEQADTPIGELIHDVVIETYTRVGSVVETAKLLGLRRPVVRQHIKEWQSRAHAG